MLFGEDYDYTTKINNESNRFNLLWFVDDIEAVFQEFKERKIEITSALKEYDYGMKEFAFVDINGYYIRLAESINND